MDNKTMLYGGVLLVIVALVLGLVQHYGGYNFYGASANKWYFYGGIGVIGVIGIVVAAWAFIKKPSAPVVTEKPTQ